MFKKALKRALTTDADGLTPLLGPEGRMSGVYILALAIRSVIVILVFLLAVKLGLPVEAILELIGFQS